MIKTKMIDRFIYVKREVNILRIIQIIRDINIDCSLLLFLKSSKN